MRCFPPPRSPTALQLQLPCSTMHPLLGLNLTRRGDCCVSRLGCIDADRGMKAVSGLIVRALPPTWLPVLLYRGATKGSRPCRRDGGIATMLLRAGKHLKPNVGRGPRSFRFCQPTILPCVSACVCWLQGPADCSWTHQTCCPTSTPAALLNAIPVHCTVPSNAHISWMGSPARA